MYIFNFKQKSFAVKYDAYYRIIITVSQKTLQILQKFYKKTAELFYLQKISKFEIFTNYYYPGFLNFPKEKNNQSIS